MFFKKKKNNMEGFDLEKERREEALVDLDEPIEDFTDEKTKERQGGKSKKAKTKHMRYTTQPNVHRCSVHNRLYYHRVWRLYIKLYAL